MADIEANSKNQKSNQTHIHHFPWHLQLLSPRCNSHVCIIFKFRLIILSISILCCAISGSFLSREVFLEPKRFVLPNNWPLSTDLQNSCSGQLNPHLFLFETCRIFDVTVLTSNMAHEYVKRP